jgi:hypothetical protein
MFRSSRGSQGVEGWRFCPDRGAPSRPHRTVERGSPPAPNAGAVKGGGVSGVAASSPAAYVMDAAQDAGWLLALSSAHLSAMDAAPFRLPLEAHNEFDRQEARTP